MIKKHLYKVLLGFCTFPFLIACDGNVNSCANAGGVFDYELKQCRCYEDNSSKACDLKFPRPADEETKADQEE